MHAGEFLLLLTFILLVGSAAGFYAWWRRRYPNLSISLQQVLHASDTAGWLITPALQVVDSNAAAQRLLETNDTLPLYFGHASPDMATDELQQLVSSGEWRGQIWLGTLERQPCLARISPLPFDHWLVWLEPNALALASEQHQAKSLLTTHVNLPNNQVFEFALRHFIEQHQHHCRHFALVLLELPELQDLQQLLSDTQLQQLWRELVQSVQPELPLGSLFAERQANQLAILVTLQQTGSNAWRELEQLCMEWLSFARGPFLIDVMEISPQLRLGAAIYPDAGREPDELVNHTAQALWQARQQPNQFMLWQQHQTESPREPLVDELETALLQYQCEVRYHALHQLESNEIVGYVSHIVWHHPLHGDLDQPQVLALVEQSSMHIQFERWVLEQLSLAISQQPQPQQATVLIQVSVTHLFHGNLLDTLQQLCQQYQLQPAQFILLLTENGWLLDAAYFVKQCQQLVRAGFLLALHEFGQGVCALKILSAVSWHCVMLSGRLIEPIEYSDGARNHLASLIRLVNARHLPVMAADVQQEMQAYLLHVMGCRDGYGDFWGPCQTAKQWRQGDIAETA